MDIQTAPKLLTSRLIPDAELDTGAFGIKTPAIQICRVVASDDVLYTDNSEVSQIGYDYVKKKERNIPGGYVSVIVRVKFNIKSNAVNFAAIGRIYKNGVAVGTERQAGTSYVEFTEDLEFSSGDTVELWLKNSGPYSSSINSVFTVSGLEVLTSGIVGQGW